MGILTEKGARRATICSGCIENHCFPGTAMDTDDGPWTAIAARLTAVGAYTMVRSTIAWSNAVRSSG